MSSINEIGQIIAAKRDESVKARNESGIETIWQNCEDAYLGIDDMNRHEFEGAKWAKATSTNGPVSTNVQTNDNRSTAYVRLTSRYVDFAASKLCELALPIDDKPFSIAPTPVPELMQVAQPKAPAQQAQPSLEQNVAKALLDQAGEMAEKAEKRIWDWMIEGDHSNELRKVIHDAARLGVGVLKGPIPTNRKFQEVQKDNGATYLVVGDKIAPATKWIDPWNLFPAPGCGENIHDGDWIFEREFFSAKRLRALKSRKGWNAENIDKVINEGPGKAYVDADDDVKRKLYVWEVWHFYGMLGKDDLDALGVKHDCNEAHAIVTIVNDSVLRCVLNPLESGKFPYRVMSWSRRAGMWAGVGVAEQCAMPQRMVTAATRALLNNAGKSSGVQAVIDQGCIAPADSRWEMVPDKIWLKAADAMIDDVRKAFFMFQYPNIQAQLMPIIEYALKLAEEHTSIPLVSQGFYAQNASPQTYGQAELQNNNAQTLLREKARLLDDNITEPLVRDFYEWLMLDPDVPKEEKGDFQIHAHGTSAMVERAIQETTLMAAINMSANPAFGADPKKVYKLWLKSKRIDPRDVLYSDEEMAKMQQNQQPPMPVMIAQIKEQGAMQRAQLDAQVAMQRAKLDSDRDTAYNNSLAARARIDAISRREELMLKREIAAYQLQIKKGIADDTIKAKLADTVMKLKTQKELAAASMVTGKQLVTPPTEPPGRAPTGQAYQL